MNSSIERFVKTIGYPIEEIERTEGPVSLLVDEMTIRVDIAKVGMVMRYVLGRTDEVNAALILGYAAGRILKEDAVVAYDPENDEIFLWSKIAANASEAKMTKVFEEFMTSCEWWRTALGAESANAKESVSNEFMRIMP